MTELLDKHVETKMLYAHVGPLVEMYQKSALNLFWHAHLSGPDKTASSGSVRLNKEIRGNGAAHFMRKETKGKTATRCYPDQDTHSLGGAHVVSGLEILSVSEKGHAYDLLFVLLITLQSQSTHSPKAQLKTAVVTSLFLMFGICFHMLGQSKVAPRNKRSKSHWHVFSPADRSFTIETPKPLRYFKDPEDKWLEVYGSAASELEACQSQYSVVVGTLDDKDRPNGDLSGMWLLIGGSHTDPTSETDILVEGRKAKDIIYTKAFDSGCKYRRGWIIDGGTRVYWLIYQDDELKNLSSPSTMRFLKSFHLRTKRRTIHSK